MKNTKSIFIPEGFAWISRSRKRKLYNLYCTKYREKNYEITIDIHDKDLNIKCLLKKDSFKKDKKGITFQNIKKTIYNENLI